MEMDSQDSDVAFAAAASAAAATTGGAAQENGPQPSSADDMFDSQDILGEDSEWDTGRGSDWQNGQTPSQLCEAMASTPTGDDDERGSGEDEPNSGGRLPPPLLSPNAARQLQRQFGRDPSNSAGVNGRVTFAPMPPPRPTRLFEGQARWKEDRFRQQNLPAATVVAMPATAAAAAANDSEPVEGNSGCNQRAGGATGGPIVEFGQRAREPCCSPVAKIYNFFHAVEYHEPGSGKEGYFLLINKDRKASPLKMFRGHMVDLAVALPAGLAQLDKFREYRAHPPEVEMQHVVRLISRYTGNGIDRDTKRIVETTFEVRLTASTGSLQIRGPSLWVRRYYFDKNFQDFLPTLAGVKFVEGDDPAELMRFVKECGQTD